MKNILIIAIILVFASCKKNNTAESSGDAEKEDSSVKNIGHVFVVKAYVFGEEIFSFNEKDIDSVDWQNQSFKLKKNKLDSLRNSENSFYASSASYFVVFSNNKIIDTLAFYELYQAWSHIDANYPIVCKFKGGVFSKEGWFVIVPYKSTLGQYHKRLYNEHVYAKFKQMGLLNSYNWNPCYDSTKVCNSINSTFFKDFGEKFSNEVMLHFGDSLQDDIDAIALPRRK